MTKPKSPPRAEPVPGAAKRRRTPASYQRSAGAKSAGKTVLYGLRVKGREAFSGYLPLLPLQDTTPIADSLERVRVTIEPWPVKKGKRK